MRRSDYLTLSDGTQLAYDVLLPTRDGVPADEPLPVLFKLTPYLCTMTVVDDDGNVLVAELDEAISFWAAGYCSPTTKFFAPFARSD